MNHWEIVSLTPGHWTRRETWNATLNSAAPTVTTKCFTYANTLVSLTTNLPVVFLCFFLLQQFTQSAKNNTDDKQPMIGFLFLAPPPQARFRKVYVLFVLSDVSWYSSPINRFSQMRKILSGGCFRVPEIEHGSANTTATYSNRVKFGASVKYTCDTGYTMVGLPEVKCSCRGEFENLPKCIGE